MAHKGKVMSDVSYNPEDPPEAYTNASVYTRINDYMSAARLVHGDEYDLST
jgi:serine/threonine-protein kinase RIO1